VRRTQPDLAREDNTRHHSHYFADLRRKCARIRREAPPDPHNEFSSWNIGEARCYTERSMTTRLGGCARTMASFITFVASCSETPFSSEGFGHYSVDQEPSANRAAKENFTKRIITEHSYFSSKRHGRF